MTLLKRAWSIGRSGFPVFFSICCAARIPPYLIRGMYLFAWPEAGENPTTLTVLVAIIITMYELMSFFLGVLALHYAVIEIAAGRRVTLVAAFLAALGRGKDGLTAAAWGVLIITAGLLLFLVPGLISMALFVFAGFTVVKEGLAGRAALIRSKDIVMSGPGMVAGYLLLLILVCVAVIVMVHGPLGLFLGFLFGVFELSEESMIVSVLFDLARLTADQTVPIAAAVFIWALYEAIVGRESLESDDGDPELIAL